MNNSRRTKTSLSYTTKGGRTFSYSKERWEARGPSVIVQPPPPYHPKTRRVPALAPSQVPYPAQTFRQPLELPHRPPVLAITHSQQHQRSNATYGSHNPTYLAEPQDQSRGSRRGSNHAPSSSSRSIGSGSGLTAKHIQSWVNATAQSNTLSKKLKSKSSRTHSQHAGSASGPINQRGDQSQEQDKGLLGPGVWRAPSHHSGTKSQRTHSRHTGSVSGPADQHGNQSQERDKESLRSRASHVSSHHSGAGGGSRASGQVAGLELKLKQLDMGGRDDSSLRSRRTRSKHTSSASEVSKKSGSKNGEGSGYKKTRDRPPTPGPGYSMDP